MRHCLLGMKLFALMSLGLGTFAEAAQIIVNVPASTPKNSAIYLTGQGFGNCNWNAQCVRLQPIFDSVYAAEITPDASFSLRGILFKVTRGDWNNEATDAKGQPYQNASIDSQNGPTILNVMNWRDLGVMGVTGSVTHTSVYSPELQNSREVTVWVPASYAQNPTRRYPVIYMHDGQNLFDPARSTFGVDWGVDEAITRLAQQGLLREAIVVGLDCTENRDDEYDFAKTGAQYAAFLVNTVKPLIDRSFRTNPDRNSTTIMGSSMGAIISLETAWAYPTVFSAAAAVSLPVFVTNQSIYQVLKKYQTPNIRIYMDHGTAGDDAQYRQYAEPFAKWLLTQGVPAKNLVYQIIPYAEHNEMAWSRRLHFPLEFLLNH